MSSFTQGTAPSTSLAWQLDAAGLESKSGEALVVGIRRLTSDERFKFGKVLGVVSKDGERQKAPSRTKEQARAAVQQLVSALSIRGVALQEKAPRITIRADAKSLAQHVPAEMAAEIARAHGFSVSRKPARESKVEMPNLKGGL